MPAFCSWCSSSESVSWITRFRFTGPKEVVEVREKFSSELTISLARKVCLAIFSRISDFCESSATCLASIWA